MRELEQCIAFTNKSVSSEFSYTYVSHIPCYAYLNIVSYLVLQAKSWQRDKCKAANNPGYSFDYLVAAQNLGKRFKDSNG